jgi:hypothetical protein
MNSEYEEIYNRLNSVFVNFPYFAYFYLGLSRSAVMQLWSNMDKTIQIFSKKKKRQVRADAKHFLMVNLLHMVYLPVLMHEDQNFEPGRPLSKSILEIQQDILSDINQILQSVAEMHSEEISGHQIMKYVSENWQKLRTASREIWG